MAVWILLWISPSSAYISINFNHGFTEYLRKHKKKMIIISNPPQYTLAVGGRWTEAYLDVSKHL
jgi:hypothetical protein